MQVRVIEEQPKVGRVMRRPQHPFSLRTRPWQIQPFMIAPVLPGETMKNLLLQARTVSKPLKSQLVGWWNEFYFFYVKHRDLAGSAVFQEMMLDPTTSLAAYTAGAQSYPMYTPTGGIKWVELCLERVVQEYFREEDDGAWNANLIDTLPVASISKLSAFESLRDNASANPLQDEEMPGEVSVMPFGVNAAWQQYYDQWEHMRALKLTDATYEDYLAQFGVKTPEVQELENKPELIRYVREWQYPTNTVEPTTGAPSTALSSSVAERADKDRFFKEPGFLFGVQVCRPKVYFSKQTGNVASFLNDAYGWLPPALAEQTWTSLKQFNWNGGPLNGAAPAGAYWIDMRDLFVFGDQYVNYDIAAAGDGSHVVLPDASYKARMPTAAMADALFKAAAPNNTISTDGVVTLGILGKITNVT